MESKFKTIILLVFVGCILFIKCTIVPRKDKQEGIIEVHNTFNVTKDIKDTPAYQDFSSINWFKDYLAIKESKTLYIKTDTANNTTQEYKLDCYLFENLRAGTVSEYLHFSDTAKPVKFFAIDSSVSLAGGGYYAPSSETILLPACKSFYLPDTTIGKISFKRIAQVGPVQKDTVIDIFYLRLGVSNSITNLYHLNDSIGKLSDYKPVKVVRKILTQNNIFAQSSELVIIADRLTIEREKIFDAWEKNEKQHTLKAKNKC